MAQLSHWQDERAGLEGRGVALPPETSVRTVHGGTAPAGPISAAATSTGRCMPR